MEEEEEQDLKEATRVDDETMDNITILVCNRLSASCASLDSFALSRYYVCVCVCVCVCVTYDVSYDFIFRPLPRQKLPHFLPYKRLRLFLRAENETDSTLRPA